MKYYIVVPAYKESQRLPFLLEGINEIKNKDHHIIIDIVDDGSPEHEAKKTEGIAHRYNQLSSSITVKCTRSIPNKGKGFVLRTGFKNALTEADVKYLGFIDADGATKLADFIKLFEVAETENYDCVIGSRWKSLGRTVSRSFKRHLSGRIFATILSNLFNIPIYDSQCGAKLFKKDVITKELLAFCDNDTWLFDTQLVICLFLSEFKILEYPVNWQDTSGSKISLIKDSYRMFKGLLLFKQKIKNMPSFK